MAVTIIHSHEPKYQNTTFGAIGQDSMEASRVPRRYIDEKEREQFHRVRHRFGARFGHVIPEDLFLKQVQIVKGRKLYDLNNGIFANIVSQRFKDCHDSVQPGGNQFVPVEVLKKDGSVYEGQFYFFHISTCRDALNPVLGGLKSRTGKTIEENPRVSYAIASQKFGDKRNCLAVYSDRIENTAAWHDPRMIATTFYSDAFIEALTAAGAEGWEARRVFHELPEGYVPDQADVL